ncbi:MAG: GNAT family N-acetyltransferase [Anaerolineae bacterium]|nr:GNAT family N-acetyltransferase [Anaerolineae bacterium]MDW8171564.1 GNAT family N-acetyltransferase [Anaerolineae bacterium]
MSAEPASTAHNLAIPIAQYTMDELAAIYNRARVDYIVPMPMNGKRMAEYIQAYDISMEHSLVAIGSDDHEPSGISMLGLRPGRGWITRLGVIPERRRRHTAEFLVQRHLESARQAGCQTVQLEVIKGNEPAHRLFLKLGFVETRELLIVRRAPSKLSHDLMPPDDLTYELVEDRVTLRELLQGRGDSPTWVEETPSLFNTGRLSAITARAADGRAGWLAFQRTPFQLTHLVFSASANADPALIRALLGQLYTLYSMMDTKIENIAADSPSWPTCQAFGYVEAFRRIEMVLQL